MRSRVSIFLPLTVITLSALSCKKEYVEVVPVVTITDVSLSASEPVRYLSFPTESVGFAATGVGNTVHRTTNGGASWEPITIGSGFCRGVCFVTPEDGLVLMTSTLYRTHDGGDTWTSTDTDVAFVGKTSSGTMAYGTTQQFTMIIFVSNDSAYTFQFLGANYPNLGEEKVSSGKILLWNNADADGEAIDPVTGDRESFGWNASWEEAIADMHFEGDCGSLVGGVGNIMNGCATGGFSRENYWSTYDYRAIDGAGGPVFAVGENSISTNYDLGTEAPWNPVLDSEGKAITGSFWSIDVISSSVMFIGGANGQVIKCVF